MVILAFVKLPGVATVASVVGILEVPVPVTSPVRAMADPPPTPEGPMMDTTASAVIVAAVGDPLATDEIITTLMREPLATEVETVDE
jgi:hypothetical protein